MERTVLLVVTMMLFLLLTTSCMTPRQTEAIGVLRDLYERGVLSLEQFNALVAALTPVTWVTDAIAIASGLIGGVGGYVATNIKRNSMRRARGEPVAAK